MIHGKQVGEAMAQSYLTIAITHLHRGRIYALLLIEEDMENCQELLEEFRRNHPDIFGYAIILL